MPGSAMAAALAAQEAARRQRRMDAEVARRRELRRAQLHAGVPATMHERHPFACAAVCLECGHLELPKEGGDPMRTDRTAIALPERPCDGCGQRVWIDLADVAQADALREHERREIALRGGTGLAIAGFLGSLLVLAIGIAGAVGGQEIVMMFSTFAIGVSLAIFTAHRAWVGITTPARTAARWRAPVRTFRIGGRCGEGVAHGVAKRAPISGRSAIAWRVEVRYANDRGDAFALVEQDCAGLELAGTALTGEPTLATRATPVVISTAGARDWLRSRGIDPYDLLEVCERVIEAGAHVELHTDARGGPPVLTAGAVRDHGT